jgi:hypothetical protein
MTDTRADRTSVAAHEVQWRAVARLQVAEAMRSLLITTAVTIVILVAGGLVARWQGWQLMASDDLRGMSLQVEASGDSVVIIASLPLLVGAVGIAALVVAIVVASRTRVLVAAGATRGSVAAGQLVTLAVMTAYVMLVAAVVVAALAPFTGGVDGMLGVDDPGAVALLALRGVGAVLMALVAATAITAVFLRWRWWVGVVGLVVLGVLVPWLVAAVAPGLGDVVSRFSAWPASDLLLVVPGAVVYWLVVRRVPVP